MKHLTATAAKFRRAFALLFQQRAAVVTGLLCVPVAALLSLALPLIAGHVIDLVATGGTPASLGYWCAAFAVTALADVSLRFVARHRLIGASRRMEERLRSELMQHVGRLPLTWFDSARTGDLISRMTQDVELLRFVTGPLLLHGGHALIVVPGGIWVMFALSPWVALTSLIAFLVLILALRALLPRMHERSRAAQRAIGDLSQRGSEAFAGIRLLLAFARARDETRAIEKLSEDCLGHNLGVARLNALVNLAIRGSVEFVVLAVLVVGALEATAGNMTIGELLESFALLGIMVWPLLAIGWILSALPRAAAAAERIEEIFDLERETDHGSDVELHCNLVVEDLTFRYPGQDEPSLRNLSFELHAGEKLGLVGPIGAGKSTLLALLLRLYDPPRGTMFVDGHDILDLHPTALRRAFAFAPQEPFLFSGTVEDNIDFGVLEDSANVDRFVHAAGLDADIDALPDGLDTIVGVRGLTLSGGQKQRVALARALAAGRPALLLDDTLSAVDHPTEQRILERLDPLRGRQTTIVASHRLSAVRDADRILVLDGGRIVERGRHADLAADESSFYGVAWRRQSESRALEGLAEEES